MARVSIVAGWLGALDRWRFEIGIREVRIGNHGMEGRAVEID